MQLKHWFLPTEGQRRFTSIWVFGLVGLLLLYIAVTRLWDTYSFVTIAQSAEGEIARVDEATRLPVIAFKTRDNIPVETFHFPPMFFPVQYQKGDYVELYYNPEFPPHALIKGFRNLWLYPLQALLGGVFLLWVTARLALKHYIPVLLAERGERAIVQFTHVSTSLSPLNRGRVWYIHAEWKYKDDLRNVKSEPLKFDPTLLIKLQEFEMLYNPYNLKMYHINLDPVFTEMQRMVEKGKKPNAETE